MATQLAIWTCQYCGKDTSNVDMDYLSNYDHLGCALDAEMKVQMEASQEPNPVDKCVLCGEDTAYRYNDHIDVRIGYIEGAGQLCIKCWNKGTDRRHMTVPMSMVYDTPNDQELGAKVRQLYYENNS
jgi:hypothetical protein